MAVLILAVNSACFSLPLHFYSSLDLQLLDETFHLIADSLIIYNFDSRVLRSFRICI